MSKQASTPPGESHVPVPGYWYISSSARLMRVRFVAYAGEKLQTVMIQYTEGVTQAIDIDDWHGLDLVAPCYEQDELLLDSDSPY